ncbi:MAG: exported protein of unknown function [Chloroflexi bacterium]|nr:exported protein of unknown function [Chloroflexota bacterium]
MRIVSSSVSARRRWSLLTLGVTLAFALAACRGPEPAASPRAAAPAPAAVPGAAAPEPAAAPKPITHRPKVGLGGGAAPEFAWAVLIAEGLGYFAQEGIEVDGYILGSGAVLNQGFIAGDMEFLLTGLSEVANNRLAGVPAKAVMAFSDKPLFSLVVRNELKDQVKSVTDLRGKTLGFTAPGSLAWFAARLWLSKAGLDPDNDLQFTPIGADAAVIYQSLQSGRIDAFPAWEPVASRLLAEGVAFRLIDSANTDHTKQWFGVDPWQDTPLMVRESLIKDKPELVGGFVKASMRGSEWVRSHSAQEIVDAMLKNPKGTEVYGSLPRDILLEVATSVKAKQGTGCFQRQSAEGIISQAAQFQVIRGPVSFEDYADTTWSGVCR